MDYLDINSAPSVFGLKIQTLSTVYPITGDSKRLVDNIVSLYQDVPKEQIHKMSALDVGTGTGLIALSIKKLCEFGTVDAADVSEQAVELAKLNSQYNPEYPIRKIYRSNLFSKIPQSNKYDLIIGCLPCFSSQQYEEDTARPEPRIAFDAGEHRNAILYPFIVEATRYLNDGGRIIVQTPRENQALEILDAMNKGGYEDFKVFSNGNSLMSYVSGKFNANMLKSMYDRDNIMFE